MSDHDKNQDPQPDPTTNARSAPLDLSGKTVDEQLVLLAGEMANSIGEMRKHGGAVAQVQKDLTDVRQLFLTEQQATAKVIADVRDILAVKHGQSGADDYRWEMKKWMHHIFAHKSGREVADWAKDGNLAIEKADYTTTTGATAGYMVPTTLMPDLVEISLIYGGIKGRVQSQQMPAGGKMDVSADLVLPTAGYQTNQGTDMAEGGGTLQQDTLTTALCGGFCKIANELLESEIIGFVDWFVSRMAQSIDRVTETGILTGDDDAVGDGTDPPHNGVINTTGCNDQTNIADSTIGSLLTFISEAAADHEASGDPTLNTIVVTPAKLIAMAQDALGATGLGGVLTWGDPVNGIPPKFFGYDIIAHPGAQVSTTHYAIMLNHGSVVVGETRRLAVDLNPYGTGWTSNESWLKVHTHNDFTMGVPDAHSFADYT